jgi:hypothetical protein|tara:strand:- start:1007 stop:1729 length:723 start_codon:yes stop_codon:yes gene_type:complete
MRPVVYTTEELVRGFDEHRVLTLEQVKGFLGTPVKMTALRKLRALDYLSSYSHTGRYYTLKQVARWDGHGLWVHKGVRFSRHGSLLETLAWLIEQSSDGRFASELEDMVRVRVQEALRTLYRRERVFRHQIGSQYLYVSVESGTTQLERRQAEAEKASLGEPDEPHLAAFLDTLNEKQRRLYAGFESLRLGHGGDAVAARRTGLNVKTVARGRKELQAGDISLERIRAEGAGRPRTKKKP